MQKTRAPSFVPKQLVQRLDSAPQSKVPDQKRLEIPRHLNIFTPAAASSVKPQGNMQASAADSGTQKRVKEKTCVYIYIYKHNCVYVYIHISRCILICIQLSILVYIYTYISTYRCIYRRGLQETALGWKSKASQIRRPRK